MFNLSFNANGNDDLKFLKKADQALIMDAIKEQLSNEPLQETRNRKPLRPNQLASWELRVAGAFRVFYDVEEENQEVVIKAIGWKDHNKLYLRGKEHKL